ncbi:hypothetical protein TIFTF001_030486 [Ficus carica]|uniref:Uncharacterized protein n=1 Tax=Ficus carica TaxID=3494 RepID=A0AA88IZR9_FICCA|nr:hypothetical protein TIFTF001_030486 [Ficus carica]
MLSPMGTIAMLDGGLPKVVSIADRGSHRSVEGEGTATRHGMFIFVNSDSVSRSSSFSLFVYAWINREVLPEESFYIMSCQGYERYVDGVCGHA